MNRCKTLLILILPSICACINVNNTINDTETLIHTHPSEALKAIESTPESQLGTERQRAEHSLLYAMALEENGIDTTDAGIIRPAIRYYSKHGPAENKMKAYYQRGKISSNRGDYPEAMYYYLLALEDSSSIDNDRYKTLINYSIANAFAWEYNIEQELNYELSALNYAERTNDSTFIWAITSRLVSIYGDLRMWQEADSVFTIFASMSVADSVEYINCNKSYAKTLLLRPQKDPALCAQLLEGIISTAPEEMDTDSYGCFAYAQQLLGNQKLASSIISELSSFGKDMYDVKFWRYQIYRNQGKFQQAYDDLEDEVMGQDSMLLSFLSESLVRVQHDYFQAETFELKEYNKLATQRLVIVSTIAIILLMSLSFSVYRMRLKAQKRMEQLSDLQQHSEHMLDLQSKEMARELTKKEALILDMQTKLAKMYKNQFKTINELCIAYLSPSHKDRKEVVYGKVKQLLRFIVGDTESKNEFLTMVNDSFDGIIDKLRTDLPHHKEEDFVFIAYQIIGLDAKTISTLTSLSIGSVYTKKNRLKNEIAALRTDNRELYDYFLAA